MSQFKQEWVGWLRGPSVRFLIWAIGKTYQGRSATPLAELAGDVSASFVELVAEKVNNIDPYLKHDCVLYDDNHQPMMKFGELSPGGQRLQLPGAARAHRPALLA